ncbi:MAG: RNA pseudouridine synthase, partial [Proteobacteria bacterium]|nr:RNA pseudouridine synthase [Pseudomonadota bacterium]
QLLFQEKKIEKRYQAVVFGTPNVNSIAGNLIPAKKSRIYTKLELELSDEPNSLTLIEKQKAWGDYFRLWLKPITGKTNQIRVHLAAIGCPIVGDKKYYPDEEIFLDWFAHRDVFRILPVLKLQRQALHCESLSFASPFAGEQIDIVDHTPDWEKKISQLL